MRPASKAAVRPRWADCEEVRYVVRDWASRIGVNIGQLHIRKMRSKWASVSTAGRLTLNSELTTLPHALAEFVIVHELVHLLMPNHGKVFKSFMYAYLRIGKRVSRDCVTGQREACCRIIQ